jgi:hypothetical protein
VKTKLFFVLIIFFFLFTSVNGLVYADCPIGCNLGCGHQGGCPQWGSCYMVGNDCVKNCDTLGYCNWDYCPGGCVPPCETDAPSGSINLSSPANGALLYGATSVSLTWATGSDFDWEESCDDTNEHFVIYVNGSEVGTSNTRSFTYNINSCTVNYSWYVQAHNGAESGVTSATWSFRNVNRQPTGTISGPVSGNLNSNFTYSATVDDPDANVTRLTLHRRKETSPGVWSAWINLSSTYESAFSPRASASHSSTWTPSVCNDVGRWQVVVNAYDDGCISGSNCIGGGYDCKCTGNPDCSPPNCGTWAICNPSGVWAAPPAAMYTTVNPVYTFTAHVWDLGLVPPSEACPAEPTNTPRAEANVSVTYEDGTVLGSGVTDANGNFSIHNIQADGRKLRVSVNCSGSCNPYTCNQGYSLVCNDHEIVGANIVTIDPGIPSCGSTYTHNFGLRERPGERWYTTVDGDAVGDSITDNLCETPSGGGFTGHIINREFRSGYAISDSSISTGSATNAYITASGGFSKNGSIAPYSSLDTWLQNYNFSVPASAQPLAGLNLSVGSLYRTTVSTFNSTVGDASHTYSISGDGMAVLFVERDGVGSIVFNGSLTSDNPNRRLLIVTDAPIYVRRNVGYADGQINKSSTLPQSAPNIDAMLVTTDGITIESLNSTDTPDIPIILQGPVISKGVFSLNRNLLVANRIYPAGVFRYYGKALYYLTQLERSQVSINRYTGFFQTDTPPWDYQ